MPAYAGRTPSSFYIADLAAPYVMKQLKYYLPVLTILLNLN